MTKAPASKTPVAKVVMENVNSPGGHVVRVDADKYNAMKRAILAVLPKASPGHDGCRPQEGFVAAPAGRPFS